MFRLTLRWGIRTPNVRKSKSVRPNFNGSYTRSSKNLNNYAFAYDSVFHK
jgi:hypothetical protein